MIRLRIINLGLILSLLLSSAGALASSCATVASDDTDAHHAHLQSSVQQTTTGATEDCCERCDALCGMSGCSALATGNGLTGTPIVFGGFVERRDKDNYLPPSPHSPFRPPILL